jgi:hypothetical protein
MKHGLPPNIEEQAQEQAALYALGMLTMHEASAFEQLLSDDGNNHTVRLREFESVVGNIGLGAPEQPPPDGVRERLLARIGHENNQTDVQTKSLTNFVTLRADQGKWNKIANGAFVKKLFVDEVKRTVTSLVKLQPGGRLESHRHHFAEECYILEGDYHVNGEVLGPGDYHCALPGSVDEELFSVGGTLFLLIAPLHYDPLNTEN